MYILKRYKKTTGMMIINWHTTGKRGESKYYSYNILTPPPPTLVQEPKEKEEVCSPLIAEVGNPMDQNIHLCYYSFWPGDISRKAQETQN